MHFSRKICRLDSNQCPCQHPPLSFQHQQQVLTAVERAKQVSMSELNAIIGVSAMNDAVTIRLVREGEGRGKAI